MTTRQSALFALFLGIVGLLGLSGCSAGNPNMSEAERAVEQQNYERALANVDTAITQDSANAEAYLMKARILRQMADSTTPPNKYKKLYARARKAEQKAIKYDPGQRSAVQNQRKLAFIQQYQKGAKDFNQARKTRSKEQFLRAAAYFGAAGAIRPDSTGPILNEAYARLRAARLSESGKVAQEMSKVIPILEKYIRKEEEPTKSAYTILAQLYLQNKKAKKTIEVTEQALKDLSQRPTHFRISGTKGVKYTGTIEAGGSSRSVEGTVPDRVRISASEGTVSGSFRKQEGGKRQKKGRLQVALYVQGTEAASKRTMSPTDTLTISQDLSEMAPLAELRNLRLNALNRAGQTKKAMQAYREEIKRNPKNATYRYNYGSLLLNADRYDAAAKQLEKAVELDPDDPKKQYNLGAAYLNKGVAL
ncbi:MAG: tetratricopeptide repeat protein, partial [Salinibacter sp.]